MTEQRYGEKRLYVLDKEIARLTDGASRRKGTNVEDLWKAHLQFKKIEREAVLDSFDIAGDSDPKAW